MTIDLDALEALEKKATQGPWRTELDIVYHEVRGPNNAELGRIAFALVEDADLISAARNALPELLRLARIGQKVEEEGMKRPDFLIQALNEGDGVYRP